MFSPITTEEWDNLIIKDLKGLDVEKKTVWKTEAGFKVKPYYRAEDLQALEYLDTLPGQFPYVRTSRVQNNRWEIVQRVDEQDPAKAHALALDALDKGATNIAFNAIGIESEQDIFTLLDNLDIEKNGFKFFNALSFPKLAKLLVQFFEKQNANKEKINVVLGFDPLAWYAKNNRFWQSQEQDFQELLELLSITKAYPHFKVVNVNGVFLHNTGANLVQEMGYVLAFAHEYLNYAVNHGFKAHEFTPKLSLSFAISSNYFLEIAKLRAARMLWAAIASLYRTPTEQPANVYINAVASSWNQTIYDAHVNMLRATTEAMSAAIGGADSILLKPYDAVFRTADEFSRRICRDTQVILQEESGFDKVIDPSAGSYYIEMLTDIIAEQTWNLFKETEKDGGIVSFLVSEKLKNTITESAKERENLVASRKSILLGTNLYPNPNETMIDKLEQKRDSTVINKDLLGNRGAVPFETLRLQTEQYAKTHPIPSVFLLKIGNLVSRQARAGFATNFFGCAGYRILDNAGFSSVSEGVETALHSRAPLVVICSSDEDYATIGAEAIASIKEANPRIICIVAGYPADSIDHLRAAGADDFISLKTNVLDSLQKYNEILLNIK
jgi:methylmalonyl-CoA mutase